MVRDFCFLMSWTDQFWCVDPWFEAEHDSEPPTSFFAYSTIFVDLRSKIYIKRLYRGSKLDFKYNHDHVHHRPGIQGPVPIGPGPDQQPKIGNLGPFRTRTNADLETSGRTSAKKLENLGLTRTARSAGPCLDRPFRDRPVEALVDSKHLKLH